MIAQGNVIFEGVDLVDVIRMVYLFFFFFTTVLSQWDSPMGDSGWLPRGSQLRQSRATQPPVRARCFSVPIIHRTLTWTLDLQRAYKR